MSFAALHGERRARFRLSLGRPFAGPRQARLSEHQETGACWKGFSGRRYPQGVRKGVRLESDLDLIG
jgi:hypothetical protein